jgi:hypothetical protein
MIVYEGKCRTPVCIVPAAATQTDRWKGLSGRCRPPVHKSGESTRFVDTHSSQLGFIRMPGYYLTLNAYEWLNQDVHTNGPGKSCPTNRTELMALVTAIAIHGQPQSRPSTTLSLTDVKVKYVREPITVSSSTLQTRRQTSSILACLEEE